MNAPPRRRNPLGNDAPRSGAATTGRLAFLAALAAVAVCATGCGRTVRSYALAPDFSVNIGRFNPGWMQSAKEHTEAQKEALATRGRPDFVRLRWSETEEIIDRSTYWKITRTLGPDARPLRESWIYEDKGEGLEFPAPGESRAKAITEKLRRICKLGDPQRVEVLPEGKHRGKRVEKWTYYNHGRIFTFADDVLVDTISIPPMRQYQGF